MPRTLRRGFPAFLISIALVSACARNTSIATTPTPAGSTITILFHGVVYEMTSAGRRPVAGAEVMWCDTGSCRPSASVLTDGEGRYAIWATEAVAQAFLTVRKDGYQQVQSNRFTGSGSAELDIQLSSIPPSANGVFGVVFEVTPTGKLPISGAKVWSCDDPDGFECSSVTTGGDGRYQFEFGPRSGTVYLFVQKPGYRPYWRELFVVGHVEHDVALVRQ